MKSSIKKIMFICTGNTCRSPIAEVVTRNKLLENKIKISVISRGIIVPRSTKANEKAINIVKINKLDLEKHMSKQVIKDEIDDQTLILTMTLRHKQILLFNYPDLYGKVYTVNEYVDRDGDIEDPYGQPIEIYKKCYYQIEEFANKLISKLQKEEH